MCAMLSRIAHFAGNVLRGRTTITFIPCTAATFILSHAYSSLARRSIVLSIPNPTVWYWRFNKISTTTQMSWTNLAL